MSLVDKLDDLLSMSGEFQELNMQNYSDDQVSDLNEWAISVSLAMEDTLTGIIGHIAFIQKMNDQLFERNLELEEVCYELESKLHPSMRMEFTGVYTNVKK